MLARFVVLIPTTDQTPFASDLIRVVGGGLYSSFPVYSLFLIPAVQIARGEQ